ncbi:MAG: cytochrome c peroxidase, partial [Myxococcota bacterium]
RAEEPMHELPSPSPLITTIAVLAITTACDLDRGDDEPPGVQGDREPGTDRPGARPEADLVARVRMLAARHDVRPTPPAPEVSDAMWTLGRALAFDKLLSGNEDVSCMTCHHPSIGTDDDRALPSGVGGRGLGVQRTGGDVIPRNAPALFNLHTYRTMFWDNRVARRDGTIVTPAGELLTPAMYDTLEYGLVSAQAMFPVTSREEMRGHPGDNELADLPDDDLGGIWSALMQRMAAVPEYPPMFEDAYPGESFEGMTFAHAANAIAAFEVAAFEATSSPWDRMLAGDDDAMTEAQLRGAALFFERGCASCHSGVGLSDFRAHNIALPQFGPGKGHGSEGRDDFGVEGVTGRADDRYAFRTPPLYNVALTAPYGHAGQFQELRDHVAHYAAPARSLTAYQIDAHVDDESLWPTWLDNVDAVLARVSPRLRRVRLRDDEQAVDDIVTFLGALTDDDAHDLAGLVPEAVPSGLPVAD